MSEVALLVKLREVAEQIPFVEKRGENKHHHYNFVQAVDVTRTVRDELLKRGVVVIPSARNARHLAYGSKGGHLTTVDLTYRFKDVESGAEVVIDWVGVGADVGGDKGIYKAYTGGFKYALLSLFMVPMTEDPEKDELTERPQSQDTGQRPAAPRIPADRAKAIFKKAQEVGMHDGIHPHPVFKAVLAEQGVSKIGLLNVDQAEYVDAFLAGEEV